MATTTTVLKSRGVITLNATTFSLLRVRSLRHRGNPKSPFPLFFASALVILEMASAARRRLCLRADSSDA